MASTSDGTVYLSAQLGASDNAIFRLDVAQDTCVRVLTVPYPQLGLCRGPSDTLYGATYHDVGLSSQGEVYKLDVTGHAATIFASGFGQSVGIIYDPSHFRLYVVEQGGQIWKISDNMTPTKSISWGGLKSLYR